MKTIIVPTDFSASADNAMNYAAQLAQQINATLLLTNVYQLPVAISDMPVMVVSADELKENAERGLERLKEQLQKTYTTLDVRTESRLGDVVEEVKDLCESVQPFAIVVGKHGASGVERLLFGSTTISMIRESDFPVIAIPHSTTIFSCKQIALAADSAGCGNQEKNISAFVQATKAALHIIHIHSKGKDAPAKNQLQELQPVYETIQSEDFTEGINGYIHTHQIDLLMILPHKHSFLERFFFKTHTPELLEKIQIPVVCIPEV